jgi:hypothetical protein
MIECVVSFMVVLVGGFLLWAVRQARALRGSVEEMPRVKRSKLFREPISRGRSYGIVEIRDGMITADHIADGSVTAERMR